MKRLGLDTRGHMRAYIYEGGVYSRGLIFFLSSKLFFVFRRTLSISIVYRLIDYISSNTMHILFSRFVEWHPVLLFDYFIQWDKCFLFISLVGLFFRVCDQRLLRACMHSFIYTSWCCVCYSVVTTPLFHWGDCGVWAGGRQIIMEGVHLFHIRTRGHEMFFH